MPAAHFFQPRIQRVNFGKGRAGNGQIHQIGFAEQARSQTVMQIMVAVGHIIGNGGHLCFGAGVAVQFQIPQRVDRRQRIRQRSVMFGIGVRANHRTVVFGNAFQTFPCQVQTIKIGIMTFQRGDNPQGLRVVIKAAIGRHQRRQRVFTGMAERGVAKIMRQRYRFGQIGVQAQHPRNCARHLRDFNRMGQAGAVVIPFMFHKHLRFMFQPPERRGMNDPVSVALKG